MKKFLIFAVLAFTTGCASNNSALKTTQTANPVIADVQPDNFVVSQLANSSTYGYSQSEPIKVGGPENGPGRERRFLNQLAGPKGEAITYSRLGSCCHFETPRGFMGTGLLDKYQVYVEGDPAPKILYLNMYDYEQPMVPHGFTSKK